MKTLKVKFDLTVGFLVRKSIRQELSNSKAKLEYNFPECRVLLTEKKGFFESIFFFEANNIPMEAEQDLIRWKKRIESSQN